MAGKKPDEQTGFETASELRQNELSGVAGRPRYLLLGCLVALVLVFVLVILYFATR